MTEDQAELDTRTPARKKWEKMFLDLSIAQAEAGQSDEMNAVENLISLRDTLRETMRENSEALGLTAEDITAIEEAYVYASGSILPDL